MRTYPSGGLESTSHARAPQSPSFVFAGASRAGSSWFFEVLRCHPGVYVPPNKGSFFFTRFYDMGLDWYEGFFRSRRCRQIAGEVCEDYLSNAAALTRIREYRSDMRFVCCLRNPYERALSAWRFLHRNGLGRPTLGEQGALSPELFGEGCYARHLRVLRSLFPEPQMRIFLFEELASAPERVARELYQFVGADPQFHPASLRRRMNVNGRPRSRMLARIVHDVHARSWGRSRTLSDIAGALKQIRPLRALVKAALYDERPIPIDWRAHIAEFPAGVISLYEREISALQELLGRDLQAWRVHR